MPGETLLCELKNLVGQIGATCCDGPPCGSCCAPPCGAPYLPTCNFPFAQVTMTVPPPIMAPTRPEPVKPLCIPCPQPPPQNALTPQEREISRYDSFYNNYNVNWRDPEWETSGPVTCKTSVNKKNGVTVDGQTPCCDLPPKKKDCPDPGCPTGFKPCSMKLSPPPCCHPMLPWNAEIQPCPIRDQLKKKKKSCC